MRLLRWLGRVLLILVLLIAGTVGVVVWRVRRGPVPLDFLVPRLKAALATDEAWHVDIEGLELVWEAAAHHAELHARGLRIARPNEGASVTLAAAHIRLNRAALLRGQVVVTAIELEAPSLQLVRDVNGQFAMQLESPATEARDLGWLWSMMRRLEHVAVRDGRVAFIDEASGTSWAVPHVDGDVWRAGGPLRVQVGLTLATGGASVPLWVDAFYRIEAGTLALQMSSPGTDTSVAFAAWPPTVASKAHQWVTAHVKDGRIGSSVLAVTGHVVPGGETLKLALDGIDASVGFEGLTVRYLDTMPTVAAVGGVARFTRESVDVAVSTGKLDALAVGPARVHVAWPAGARDRIAIDAHCRGPLASLAGVLDHEPVTLGQRLSFQTRGIAGSTASRIRLAFPLDGPHKLGTLGLRATSTITDATVPYVAGDWEITRGNATVAVDDRAVAIEGTADLHGVPASFTFEHHFGRPTSQHVVLAARLDAPERQALGIDLGRSIAGPVDARVRFAPRRDGRLVADVEADLAPATITVPALAIDKPPGEPGRAVARLGITRGVVSAVEHFDVSVGGVTIRGDAGRPPTGGSWNRVDAEATFALPDPGGMTLALRAQDQRWLATLTSSDLGLLLRAYGYDGARGGRATLDGVADLGTDGVPFEGKLTIEDMILSRVPWLVKLVTLASIRGLLDLGSDKSVVVDRAVATVAHRPPSIIEIRDAVARGPQIGLNLAGTVDHTADTLDLTGTIIPSYFLLNEGVDRIPVIGGIIGLATGGAMEAMSFTARGPRGDPVVAVQPLSSLAPGVLREWLRKLGW
jgi:hypothetical protein